MGLLRRGLSGEPVRLLQERLGIGADGIFGKGTEDALIAFQNENGLSPDGIAGPDVFTVMNLPALVLLHKPIRGEQVKKLQEGLGLTADGVFGSGTEAAVKKLQEENGLTPDGMAGPETLAFVPGFEVAPETIAESLVTEQTPTVDPGAAEAVKVSEDAPPVQQGLISYAAHEVVDTASLVGKSIWNTVKSIF